MKIVLSIVVLAILGWVAWMWLSPAPAPVDETMDDTEMVDDMPAVVPGEDMVDDMEVTDDGMSDNGLGDASVADASGDTVVVALTGKNFEFSQKEIRVTKGQTVHIDFTSEDGFHDWTIDEFDAATAQVQTGETSSVEFVADQVGEFEYYCSVGQHRANGMVGKLIVTE